MGMPGGVWRRGAAGRVGCGAAGRRAGGQAAGLVVPGGVRAASRSRFSHPSAMSRHRSNARASAEAIRDGLYDVEIHKIICSTNAIERLNARYRRAVRVRGHLPNEPGALKCLYLPTPRRCQGPQACSSPGKAAGARTRRYADRRIERSGHHFAGCRSTGRSRATLTTPPCGATLQHRDVAVRRPHDPRARGRPRPNFPPIPAASWPRGRPGPRAHAETTRTPGDIGPGELPGTPRDLKTARSLRQGEDHLSGIPRFASEPRQNRSSATKGSGGMRSRVRRRAPVRFCWKRRHDMGSLIDNCSSCSSPQVSA
jgi:hypothetical protein